MFRTDGVLHNLVSYGTCWDVLDTLSSVNKHQTIGAGESLQQYHEIVIVVCAAIAFPFRPNPKNFVVKVRHTIMHQILRMQFSLLDTINFNLAMQVQSFLQAL